MELKALLYLGDLSDLLSCLSADRHPLTSAPLAMFSHFLAFLRLARICLFGRTWAEAWCPDTHQEGAPQWVRYTAET